MKKTLLYGLVVATLVTSCRKEESPKEQIEEVQDISVQNANDDTAIKKYLEEHYFDTQGNVKAFNKDSEDDDHYTKLSEMSPQTLSSGVVVVIREGAQPIPGTVIGATDNIRLMHNTTTFLSKEHEGKINYISEFTFGNTIATTGVPQENPTFYYYSQTLPEGIDRSFFEIEGFQEGLKYFKSFDMQDSENYNLQGVIIVPSRAAFAREKHFMYGGHNWRNRSFVFNFQVYGTTPREN